METEILIEKSAIEVFKHILTNNSDKYLTWKVIQEKFQKEWTNICWSFVLNDTERTRWLRKTLNFTSNLRHSYFKMIQEDAEFVNEYGMLISKNSVGIKLSKNINEIKEYIDGEVHRAKAILYKLTNVKNYHNHRVQENEHIKLVWMEE